MVSIKQQLIFTAFALAVVAVTVSATSLRVGQRQPKDGLVCVGDVNLRGIPGRVVNAQRICNVPRYNQTITQILAIDLGKAGRGGYAQILKGGVNQKSVTLYLWSQTGQPLNFTISVYAKPYW